MVEVVLVHCNLEDNQYQRKLEVLYIFTSNKSCAYVLNVEQNNNIEFDDSTITFTDQNLRSLEMEDKINLTLLINKSKSHRLFYRTQIKKICHWIWTFVICNKIIWKIWEKIIWDWYKNRTRGWKDTKLYVPVVKSLAKDNLKLLKHHSIGLED